MSFVQLRQENQHLKERVADLLKQLEFAGEYGAKDKDRRRIEQREEQARRELEHVKKEKERLVDKTSELALALKQAHDEARAAREEADRLKEKVIFYEKTFPLSLTKHKRQFVVPPLHINSEPADLMHREMMRSN